MQKSFDKLGDPRLMTPVTFGKFAFGTVAVLIATGFIAFNVSPAHSLLFWALAALLIVWRVKRCNKWQITVADILSKREDIIEQARAIG